MKKCFWCILIQPILQAGICAPVVHGMIIKSLKGFVSGITEYPKSENIGRIEAENRWKEFCACMTTRSTKLTKSQSRKIKTFWQKCSENNKIHDDPTFYIAQGLIGSSGVHPPGRGTQEGNLAISWKAQIEQTSSNTLKENFSSAQKTGEENYPSYNFHLVQATNEILLSKESKWEEKMKVMLDTIKLENNSRDSVEQIMLFQILREFLALDGLPLKVFLVIHLQLLEMKGIGDNSAVSEVWGKEIQATLKLSEKCWTQLGVARNGWQLLSACTYHSRINLSTPQSNQLVCFWKNFSKHNKILDHYPSYFLRLVKDTNEILLSPKVYWEEMMKRFLDEAKIDTISNSEQVSISQITKEFLSLKELPSGVVKVIDLHKKKIQQTAPHSGVKQVWNALKTIKEFREKNCSQIEEYEGIWKDFSACTYPRIIPLTKSQSNAIESFWKKCSEVKQEDEHPPTYYSDLVMETNEILLADKVNWEAMMMEMLDKIKLDWSTIQQISLFRILRGFLTLKDLPPNVLGVIDTKLTRMATAAKMPLVMKSLWNELQETRELIRQSQERQSLSELAARS